MYKVYKKGYLIMEKRRRQAIIKRILTENNIGTQEELMQRLEREDIYVTQSTISRDIRELNIVKSQTNTGEIFYRVLNNSVIGKKKRTDEERLIQVIEDTGVSLTQVEFTNLLTVLPGNGQVVGVLIDSIRSTYVDIVGCIAGDDSILIISRDKRRAEQVNQFLRQFLYNPKNH